MNSNTIQDNSINPQYCQDDIIMLTDKAFVSLLHNLIREHGHYGRDGITCDVRDFDLTDKRLLLSYYEGQEWLEYAYESETNTQALFDEHKQHVQEMIDNETWAVYCEFMEESGAHMVRHPNCDEVYWVRR